MTAMPGATKLPKNPIVLLEERTAQKKLSSPLFALTLETREKPREPVVVVLVVVVVEVVLVVVVVVVVVVVGRYKLILTTFAGLFLLPKYPK